MTCWTLAPAAQEATMTDSSLYDRLGGAFAIAAVVDHFSEAIVRNPLVGQTSENPDLREWHTNNLGRLPGLKFMRTLWVCDIAGGPQQYAATKPGSTPLGLEEAHRDLKISPAIFDEVAAEFGRSLDHFNVPEREKGRFWLHSPHTRARWLRDTPASLGGARPPSSRTQLGWG